MNQSRRSPAWSVFLLSLVPLMAGGCGIVRRALLTGATDTFASSAAADVWSSDDDPELVRDALPFGLKTYETLLAQDPGSRALMLATASSFVKYASAFLEGEADMLVYEDLERSRRLEARASLLYLRGRDYALAALEREHPGFGRRLREDPAATLAPMGKKDVPFLFWAGAGWAGAVSARQDDLNLVAELPLAGALARRALELDESWNSGTIHDFFISFEGARGEALGGSDKKAMEHFRRAVELSGGQSASPYVALASTVAVRRQDVASFRDLLGKALAVDPDARREWRLQNTLARRKARWLLDHVSDLFVKEEKKP